jgi:hypothetical protein
MRFCTGLLLLVCASYAYAQAGEGPEVVRAKAGLDRLRALVEAGAIPKAQLDKAEDAVADAQDAAILRNTMNMQYLTEQQADEMLAAADRRFERRERAHEAAQKLVDAGVASVLSLTSSLQDLDLARTERDLAGSRVRLSRELTQMARAEEALEARMAQEPAAVREMGERYDGDGIFDPQTFARVEHAFAGHFGKPLPVSAMGETAAHRALGFDHRGRVDVAINPDQPEGVWLRGYLTANHIPFFAFRQAVPGKATGAHIHLGPMSAHIAAGG